MNEQDHRTGPERLPSLLRGVDRRLLFGAFFFAVFVYLVYQLLLVLSPFTGALLGALIVALVFHPLHRRLRRRVRQADVAASLTTTVALVTIVVPFLVVGWLVMGEAASAVPAVRQWLAAHPAGFAGLVSTDLPPPFGTLLNALRDLLERWAIDFRGMLLEGLRGLGTTVTEFGAATVRRLLFVALDVVVLVITLYYFLRDGERMLRWLVDLVPMESHHKQLVVDRLEDTLSAMVRGTFITASVQGFLTGIGLAVSGVPFPVLGGVSAALLAVVPFIGAGLIWLPAAIYLFVTGATGAAIGLALWGVLVVGLIDNVLRPWVVGERAHLPVLLLLLAVLGGIQVYGLLGALLSPLLVATFLAFARIYREQYTDDDAARTP